MALEPTSPDHKAQIQAGIEGRKKGHNFEEAISDDINRIIVSEEYYNNGKNHLVQGRPSEELVKYIISTEDISNIQEVESTWIGGMATMNEGGELTGIDPKSFEGSKSDVVIKIQCEDGPIKVGISIKTCHKLKPTNDQLYCTTSQAFCDLLRRNGLTVSKSAEDALKMFCGERGYRPQDDDKVMEDRQSDDRRWFWEELPDRAKTELEALFDNNQEEVTEALLKNAYENDPYPPKYVFHQRVGCDDIDNCKIALFTIKELVEYSKRYQGFHTRGYGISGDPNTHQAPRFGFVQFQRLGNTQNATQLQFNLKAGYFNDIKNMSVSLSTFDHS